MKTSEGTTALQVVGTASDAYSDLHNNTTSVNSTLTDDVFTK